MRYLVFILVVFLFGSCKKDSDAKDDLLTLERKPYTGNDLRLDGYYYYYSNGKYWDLICLYKNGILLDLQGGVDSLGLLEIENNIINGKLNERASQIKYYWGLFIIDSNRIRLERLYPPTPLKTYIGEGDILNDTTFRITESYRMVDGKKTEIKNRDELYHFKEFSPKPDSTNSFIK